MTPDRVILRLIIRLQSSALGDVNEVTEFSLKQSTAAGTGSPNRDVPPGTLVVRLLKDVEGMKLLVWWCQETDVCPM